MKKYFSHNASQKAIGIVVLYVLVTIISLYIIATRLSFKYELEGFFPENDADMEFYNAYNKKFDSDFDVTLIAIKSDTHIFDKDFLSRVKTFTDSLKQSKYVQLVISPLQMARYKQSFPVPIAQPYFHLDNDSLLAQDSVIIGRTRHFVKDMISVESGTVLIIAQMQPYLKNEDCRKSIDEIKVLLEKQNFRSYHLAGRVKAQDYIISKMQSDFVKLALLTILILTIVVYLTFRNLWSVVLCAMIVSLGLVFTLLAMVILHKSLNIVSVILPNILFVVGVSDSVHVLNNYFTEYSKRKNKFEAIWNTITDIGLATFLTAITAAIGFFTLITVNVAPIQEFGIFSAIGILLIFCISFTLLPALLYLLPAYDWDESKSIIKNIWFVKLYEIVGQKTKLILILFVMFLIPISIGIKNIEINNFFTEELRDNDPHKKDFLFFDKNYGGVRPFELAIEVQDSSKDVFDYEVVKAIDNLEQYLEKNYWVKGINSSNTLVKLINQMNHEGDENAFCISENDSIHTINKESIAGLETRKMMRSVIADNNRTTRITGRVNDIGALKAKQLNVALDTFIRHNIDTKLIHTKVTGIGAILDKNNDYLTDNLMTGLIFELLAIALLMGLLFRSFSITMIALIPNVIPLVFIGGLMGWLGIHLNLSSSILFNIAFGICVDDTIHLLGAYRVNLQKGMSKTEALFHAYTHSGKAVAMTTLILCGGFFVMLTSSFVGIYNTGLLVGITLIVALLSDLFLLKFLIQYFHHPKILKHE